MEIYTIVELVFAIGEKIQISAQIGIIIWKCVPANEMSLFHITKQNAWQRAVTLYLLYI